MAAHPVELVALAAGEAGRVGPVAVQLDDLVGCDAGLLLQAVDVLRDHRRHLAGQLDELAMTLVNSSAEPASVLMSLVVI